VKQRYHQYQSTLPLTLGKKVTVSRELLVAFMLETIDDINNKNNESPFIADSLRRCRWTIGNIAKMSLPTVLYGSPGSNSVLEDRSSRLSPVPLARRLVCSVSVCFKRLRFRMHLHLYASSKYVRVFFAQSPMRQVSRPFFCLSMLGTCPRSRKYCGTVARSESSARGSWYLPRYQGSRPRVSSEAARGRVSSFPASPEASFQA